MLWVGFVLYARLCWACGMLSVGLITSLAGAKGCMGCVGCVNWRLEVCDNALVPAKLAVVHRMYVCVCAVGTGGTGGTGEEIDLV